MSKLETNTIDNISGSSTLTIGDSNASTISIPKNITLGTSGTTITVPSGSTLDLSNATQTGVGGTNTPSFYVFKNAQQAIAHATETVVTWQVERFDTDSAFASNTFTVPSGKGGKYLFNAAIRWDTDTDFQGIRLTIRKNSSNFSSVWSRNDYYQTQQLTSILDLSATDTVDIVCRHTQGGSINLGPNDQGDISWFQGFKLL